MLEFINTVLKISTVIIRVPFNCGCVCVAPGAGEGTSSGGDPTHPPRKKRARVDPTVESVSSENFAFCNAAEFTNCEILTRKMQMLGVNSPCYLLVQTTAPASCIYFCCSHSRHMWRVSRPNMIHFGSIGISSLERNQTMRGKKITNWWTVNKLGVKMP